MCLCACGCVFFLEKQEGKSSDGERYTSSTKRKIENFKQPITQL